MWMFTITDSQITIFLGCRDVALDFSRYLHSQNISFGCRQVHRDWATQYRKKNVPTEREEVEKCFLLDTFNEWRNSANVASS